VRGRHKCIAQQVLRFAKKKRRQRGSRREDTSWWDVWWVNEALGVYVRCIDTMVTYYLHVMLCYVMGQVHARAHAVHFAFVGLYDDDVGVGRVHGEISSCHLPSFLP